MVQTMIAGLDIGNGYVKGVVESDAGLDTIFIPSSVTVVTGPNDTPESDADAVALVGATNFYDRLDVSFASPAVPDNYRRLFGQRALSAFGSLEIFDVMGNISKAEQPLSKVLVLGLLAGKAVRDHVALHGALPGQVIDVVVDVALALPIDEFRRHRKSYSNSLQGDHQITLHTFETPVQVRLRFRQVSVIPEGGSAIYAIMDQGEPLMAQLLQDLAQRGMALPHVTPADLLQAQNVIGIDIGEGTVNFPVHTNGAFNQDAATTFGQGFGTVLTRAMEKLQSQQGSRGGFSSRKQLADFLLREPTAMKRAQYDRVKAVVDEEIVFFARQVAEHFSRVLSVVGAQTDFACVYGGGATPVQNQLYPLLVSKVNEMVGPDALPVLYLDSTMSQGLNRDGLLLLAKRRRAASNG